MTILLVMWIKSAPNDWQMKNMLVTCSNIDKLHHICKLMLFVVALHYKIAPHDKFTICVAFSWFTLFSCNICFVAKVNLLFLLMPFLRGAFKTNIWKKLGYWPNQGGSDPIPKFFPQSQPFSPKKWNFFMKQIICLE